MMKPRLGLILDEAALAAVLPSEYAHLLAPSATG